MSGLFRTDGPAGYVHAEAYELDRKLREGDGMVWPGDPRLSLQMGVLTAPQSRWEPHLGRRVQRGEVMARRYEVWRHTEDGEDVMIGHWLLSEFDRILLDLAPMRLDAPGHVDALAAIDEHNDRLTKEAGDAFREKAVETFAHALDVWNETENGKTTFRQMPGLRDESPSSDTAAMSSGGDSAS